MVVNKFVFSLVLSILFSFCPEVARWFSSVCDMVSPL